MTDSRRPVPRLLLVATSLVAAAGFTAAGLHDVTRQAETKAAPIAAAAGIADSIAPSLPETTAPAPVAVPTPPQAPAPPAPPPKPPVNPAVVQQARHLVGLAGGNEIGVLVVDAEGDVVVDYRANDPFVPASTAKTLTAAAALVKLGPDYRYNTRVLAPNRPDANGVLQGDLVLQGSGDPVLASPLYQEARPDRPSTPLSVLADAIQGAGIRQVTGGVIGDSSVFAYQPSAPGWESSDFADGDAARISGLMVNGGRRVWRGPTAIESLNIGDPSREAAEVLEAMLEQRGITLGKRASSSTVPLPAREQIGQVTSQPLWQILQYMVQRSDNQVADGVFRTLGVAAGDPSWQGSQAELVRSLERLGVGAQNVALPDGSGLSRAARVTPNLLTEVDEGMARSANAAVWLELLAVAGRSGTLKNRLVGTPAEGRVRGKTGTLDEVTALSGVVLGDAGPRYRFAVIGNGLDNDGKDAVRRLQDDLAQLLAFDAALCPTGCG